MESRDITNPFVLLEEILRILPPDSLRILNTNGSKSLKEFLNSPLSLDLFRERFKRTGSTLEVILLGSDSKQVKELITEDCPVNNSYDFCLRHASEQGSAELANLFVTEGATDISGALAKAAEVGSYELIEMLQDKATRSMFGMVAGHAALKGHKELTKSLYLSGEQTQENLNSILAMAVEGGHVDIILWALNEGADQETVPSGLIGKNFKNVLPHIGSKQKDTPDDEKMYLYGVASFGDADDIDYVLEEYPNVSKVRSTLLLAFTGALENGNTIGATILENKLSFPEKDDALYRDLLLSATRGNQKEYVSKYLRKADRIIPALLVAVSNKNFDIVNLIEKSKKELVVKTAPLYAAYSGSSEMIQHFVKKSPNLRELTLMAYGASAGGNWDFLNLYLTALKDSVNEEEYIELLKQVVAESIRHSQLSLFNNLYNNLKNEFDPIVLHDILSEAKELKSKLVYLPIGTIHPSIVDRLDKILDTR